jgi:hypothetical protein
MTDGFKSFMENRKKAALAYVNGDGRPACGDSCLVLTGELLQPDG